MKIFCRLALILMLCSVRSWANAACLENLSLEEGVKLGINRNVLAGFYKDGWTLLKGKWLAGHFDKSGKNDFALLLKKGNVLQPWVIWGGTDIRKTGCGSKLGDDFDISKFSNFCEILKFKKITKNKPDAIVYVHPHSTYGTEITDTYTCEGVWENENSD